MRSQCIVQIVCFSQRMGSESSAEDSHPVHGQASKWEREGSFEEYQVVRNSENRVGELYILEAVDSDRQMKIFRMRYDNPQYIVTVYSAKKCSEKFLCAVNQSIQVVTERIPYRLGDLGTIGYDEGLYMIHRILNAAKIIRDQYLSKVIQGKFINNIKYEDNMVCITQQGMAKLWINERLGSNDYGIDDANPKQQSELVQNLMNLIENKMSGNKFIKYMKEKIKIQQRNQLQTIEDALIFIQEMRNMEKLATGVSTNRVNCPQKVLTLQGKKNSKLENSENSSSIYGSKIRSSIQEAQKTHNFAKLEKPPMPRKSSKSKSKASSRSSLSPSNKPVARQKSPGIIEYKRQNIASQSFPLPSLISVPSVHPLVKKLSNSAVNQRQQIKIETTTVSKPLSVRSITDEDQKQFINPFREIERENSKQKMEKKQKPNNMIIRIKSTENLQKNQQKKEGSQQSFGMVKKFKPMEPIKTNEEGKNTTQVSPHVAFSFGTPLSQDNRKLSNSYKNLPNTFVINGQKVDSNQQTYTHKIVVPPNRVLNSPHHSDRKYEPPQITFKSNAPKVNFTFGNAIDKNTQNKDQTIKKEEQLK